MTVRKSAVRLISKYGMEGFFRPLIWCLREQRKCLQRIPHWLARDVRTRTYLERHSCRKLHLGASDKVLTGWLNTDLDPCSSDVVYLDCTKPFPFPSEIFDFIFCEHFIEHLTREGAVVCLAEVFRCLKLGGVFRVATPDLSKYVGLFSQMLEEREKLFMEQTATLFKLDRVTPCLALNLIVYNWGHQFLYTREELTDALRWAGFSQIQLSEVGISHHQALINIEQHGNFYGEKMHKFETMVLEAIKGVANTN